MSAVQAQEYCDLVIAKADQLGPHYVERQLTWGAAELDRLQLQQVRPGGAFVIQPGLLPEAAQEGDHVEDERCYECSGTGERDGEECPFCRGTKFPVPRYEVQG